MWRLHSKRTTHMGATIYQYTKYIARDRELHVSIAYHNCMLEKSPNKKQVQLELTNGRP